MLLRALSRCLLNTDRLAASTTSTASLFQCFATLSIKKCFLMSCPNSPWCSFEPFPRILSLENREKSSAPPSPLSPLQEDIESNDVAPQPPFLQTRQAQSPQLLLTEHAFQTSHQLCCPPLDTFKDLFTSFSNCGAQNCTQSSR